MNPYRHFIGEIVAALQSMQMAGELPEKLDFSPITAEPPRDAAHGDIATNAAMVLAKAAGRKPREIADALLPRLKANPDVVAGSVAGPGFINLKIADGFWRERLRDCLKAGVAYGDSTMGQGAKVNVEYVSANPTGPLHVAHARGAVVGDALANLLAKAGYDVTKEYYITTRARRSTRSAARRSSATGRHSARTSARSPRASIPGSISRRWGRRSPGATAHAGSTSPKPTGCRRCGRSPSAR